MSSYEWEPHFRAMSNVELTHAGRGLLVQHTFAELDRSFGRTTIKHKLTACRTVMRERLDELLKPEPPLRIAIVDYGAPRPL